MQNTAGILAADNHLLPSVQPVQASVTGRLHFVFFLSLFLMQVRRRVGGVSEVHCPADQAMRGPCGRVGQGSIPVLPEYRLVGCDCDTMYQ